MANKKPEKPSKQKPKGTPRGRRPGSGGRRPGAGRPALPPSEQATMRAYKIHPPALVALARLAIRWECSATVVIERAILAAEKQGSL